MKRNSRVRHIGAELLKLSLHERLSLVVGAAHARSWGDHRSSRRQWHARRPDDPWPLVPRASVERSTVVSWSSVWQRTLDRNEALHRKLRAALPGFHQLMVSLFQRSFISCGKIGRHMIPNGFIYRLPLGDLSQWRFSRKMNTPDEIHMNVFQ